jgi:hypothetical protein
LKELQSKFNKVILLLDRAPQHCHSIKVRKYLEKNKGDITVMVFEIVFAMSNTSIKYLIQAIIIIISFTIPLTLDSSSLLTTTTTALAFHVDSAGNPTMRQSDIGTEGGGANTTEGGGANTTEGGGANTTEGGGANTTVATVALNYINETRKAIQAALTNLDLAERQLSLLIGGVNSSIVGGGNVSAAISIPAEEKQERPLLGKANISLPEVVVEEEARPEICKDHVDNNHDGQIDEGCAFVPLP